MTKKGRQDEPQELSIGAIIAALVAAVTVCISSWYWITSMAHR